MLWALLLQLPLLAPPDNGIHISFDWWLEAVQSGSAALQLDPLSQACVASHQSEFSTIRLAATVADIDAYFTQDGGLSLDGGRSSWVSKSCPGIKVDVLLDSLRWASGDRSPR